VFAEAIGADPEHDLWRARYLGATCFILELRRSVIPYYWLNINDDSFPFLVLVEHTRMLPPDAYGGKHILYVGNYVARDDWRFNSDPEKLLAAYLPYIAEISPGFQEGDITGWHFSKAGFAQPIVTPTYHEAIPGHTTSLPGVFLATMSQVYPHDRGQNYAVAMGFKVAELATSASS